MRRQTRASYRHLQGVVCHEASVEQSQNWLGGTRKPNGRGPTSFHPAKLRLTSSDLIAHLHWLGALLGVMTGGILGTTCQGPYQEGAGGRGGAGATLDF